MLDYFPKEGFIKGRLNDATLIINSNAKDMYLNGYSLKAIAKSLNVNGAILADVLFTLMGVTKRSYKEQRALASVHGKETKKARYGDENYNNTAKAINTQKEVYGCAWLASEEFHIKSEATSLKTYGVKYPMQNKQVSSNNIKSKREKYNGKTYDYNKFKTTMDTLYGGIGNASEHIRNLQHKTMLDTYGVEYWLQLGIRVTCHYACDGEMFDSLPELAL